MLQNSYLNMLIACD